MPELGVQPADYSLGDRARARRRRFVFLSEYVRRPEYSTLASTHLIGYRLSYMCVAVSDTQLATCHETDVAAGRIRRYTYGGYMCGRLHSARNLS